MTAVMHNMSRRTRSALALVAAGILAAGCGSSGGGGTSGGSSPGGGATAGSAAQVPTANLIAWEGYLQPQWVKPFQNQTGCQVHATYAGTSDQMVTLMKNGGGGQYDMVSSSGDADLRIIYAGDARPVT